MLSKCSLSKGTVRGQGFIDNRRSGSGDDYRSFSPTRGKGPENPSVDCRTQIQWPDTSRRLLSHFTSLDFQF